MSFQCSVCGVRFEDEQSLKNHLYFHYLQNNAKYQKTKKSSKFPRIKFQTQQEWITDKNEDKESSDENLNKQENQLLVHYVDSSIIDKNQCELCSDEFQLRWEKQIEKWVYDQAVLTEIMQLETNQKSFMLLHFNCFRLMAAQYQIEQEVDQV